MADLEHRIVGEQGLQEPDGVVERDLLRHFAEHVVGGAMGERDVAGAPRPSGQADADQARFHAVERIGLGIDRDHAERTGFVDPDLQCLDRGDGFIEGAVDRRMLDLDYWGRRWRATVAAGAPRRLSRVLKP